MSATRWPTITFLLCNSAVILWQMIQKKWQRSLDAMKSINAAASWFCSSVPGLFGLIKEDAPRIEGGIQQVFNKWRLLGGDIPRLRDEVVAEIQLMVDDHHEETQRWFGQLPHHIQHVYSQTNGYITQLPILVQLLKACNFPELQHLEADLCEGFPLTGAQNHGPGWVAISLILSPLTPSSSSTVSTFGRSWLESLLTLTGKHY